MRKHRVLLKISGESLTEEGYRGLKRGPVDAIIREIKSIWPEYQIAVSVGGGNLYRGSQLMRDLELQAEDAVFADVAGMIVTNVNGMMLGLLMEKAGITVRHMLAKGSGDAGEQFYFKKAVSQLRRGHVIILSGGTGKPRFSTDTGAVLSACEVGAELVLKGTKVDGVYDGDPKYPDPVTGAGRTRIPLISYDEFIARDLKILDTTAVAMARDNNKRIRVFNIFEPGSLMRVLEGGGVYSEINATGTAS